MKTSMIFLWTALSLVLICLSVEPRAAQTWAALVCSVVLLVFLGRYLPPKN